MSDLRAASRYAKSLLELANEKGALEEVHADMLLLDSLCKENRDLILMLKNPIIKHGKKNEILKAIFKGKVHVITFAMFDIVTRKNRESILVSIAEEFTKQYNIKKGIEVAQVTTTVPLTDKLKKEIEAIISKVSNKKSILLEEKIDQEIIGGFVIKIGDKQIDDSVKTKIKELKVKFSQNPYIKEF